MVIGKHCKVEAGACVRNSVLLDGAHICEGSLVTNSIVGWRSKIGKWARVKNFAVLGEDVTIQDEVRVIGSCGFCSVLSTHPDSLADDCRCS